ncbi:MAG: D-hexose-6-phosphate mutarotase [Alphaproteobacteria bacterium]|nr:D-hexose-6-phosphate mutarotase [Alphaproteobacteria bacterium]
MSDSGFISLENDKAKCKLALWGADLLSYQPKGEENDVFWLGNLNKFDHIQAIRGGVPVCWLRFAAEKLNDDLPRHGFARISDWQVQNIVSTVQKSEIELFLQPDAKYNLPVTAKLFIKVSDKLEYVLETTNNGAEEFVFSEALHCYFKVSLLENVTIKGLKGHKYKSSLDGKIYELAKDLHIDGEFDAAFQNHSGNIEIVDSGYKRKICLEKQGSKSTVVWNPAKDLAEMSAGQYKQFVCVEPANQGDCFVRLKPHEKHRIAMTVHIEHL